MLTVSVYIAPLPTTTATTAAKPQSTAAPVTTAAPTTQRGSVATAATAHPTRLQALPSKHHSPAQELPAAANASAASASASASVAPHRQRTILALSITFLVVFVVLAASLIAYYSHRQVARVYSSYRRAHVGQVMRVNAAGAVEWITPPTRSRADLGLFHADSCPVGYGKSPPPHRAPLPAPARVSKLVARIVHPPVGTADVSQATSSEMLQVPLAPKVLEDSGYAEGGPDQARGPGETVECVCGGKVVVVPRPVNGISDAGTDDDSDDLPDSISYRSISGQTASWLRDYGYMGPG